MYMIIKALPFCTQGTVIRDMQTKLICMYVMPATNRTSVYSFSTPLHHVKTLWRNTVNRVQAKQFYDYKHAIDTLNLEAEVGRHYPQRD